MIIGLTGSIGGGKSTVAKIFEQYGYAVQDSDAVVHHIYNNDSDVISVIDSAFYDVAENGVVNRESLRNHLTENPNDKEKLEDIVHPIVAQYRKDFIKANDDVILDVPLLFEAGVYEECDTIVVVACDKKIRKTRVLDRGYSEQVFEMFDSSQMSQSEKITNSHFVIYTDIDLEETQQQVRDVVDQLL